MKLYSVQDVEVIQNIKNEHEAEWQYVDPVFKRGYKWYIKETGLEHPPVWCEDHYPTTYEIEGYKSYALQENKDLYLVELEVPNKLVIKSNFDNWHFVLNDWSLLEHTDIPKEETWKLIFDENFTFEDDEEPQMFQYTIPTIKPEYVKNITKLVDIQQISSSV